MVQHGIETKKCLFPVQILLLAGLYFLSGLASFSLSVSHHIVTLVVFAAEGFSLTALILLGTRLWLGVFLGQFILAYYNGLIWHAALGVAIINSIEAVIGALLFRCFALQPTLTTMRDVLGLLLLILLVLQPFSATLGNLILWLNGIVTTEHLTSSWGSWWFGNALGQALVTPLLLTLFADAKSIKQKLRFAPWLLLLAIPIAVLTLLPISYATINFAFTLALPILILIAAKGGIVIVNLAAVILTVITLAFTRDSLAQGDMTLLVDLNTHFLIILLTGQFVAALLTEHKQLVQQQANEYLQKIADHFPGMVCQFRLNPDGSCCFPYASTGIKTIYHLSPEQVQHSADPVFALIHPEDYQKLWDAIELSAKNLTPWQCDYRVRFDDGQIRWLSGHSIPQCEPDGAILWYGSIKDITELKQKEVEYRTIIEASFSGFGCHDFQGRFLSVNSTLCSMLGYSEQELLTMRLIDIEAKESQADIATHIQTVMQTGHDRFETRHKRKDGTIIDVEVSVLYMAELGQRFFVFVNDITERKLIQNALLDSQTLLQTAQKAARMGHYITNVLTETWTSDAQLDEIFGIDDSFTRDIAHWQQMIYPDDVQRVIDYFYKTIRQKEVVYSEIEYRIVRPIDGAVRWIAAWKHNFYDDQEQVYQQVGMIQDITERKLAEQQLKQTTEQLQLVLEGGHLGFWDWNIVTGEVQRNHIWAEMLGYSYEEMQNTVRQWEDFVYVDDRAKAWQSIYDTLEAKTPYHELEYRMLHKDGSIRWILDHASVMQRDTEGKPLRMSGTHTNITRLKYLEEQLRISETFFQSLAQINPVGIYRTNAQGECIFVNPKGCELLGMTLEQALGDGWANAVIRDDVEKVYNAWKAAVRENRPFALEYRFQHQDGKIIWVYGQAIAIQDKTGRISGYVGTITDITERKAIEEHVNQLAFYDSLTQLPNRRLLQERIKHGIALNHRMGNQMALLMMDLDKFKAVNDTLGHKVGDELLQQVAMRIKARLREVDMVARLGGDEFVILMENITHDEQAAYLAKSLVHSLSQAFTLCQTHEVFIGASIGIAIYPRHGDSMETLIDHADIALYHAKEQGRGCFAYFSETLTQKICERIDLEARLRNAIAQQELQLYFQPQIDIHSGQLIGAEALVRWQDPIHGCLLPDIFIPIAEETGLIIPLGEWVLQETCRYGRKWLDAGYAPIKLSVNISPYQFCHANMNLLIKLLLETTDFPPESLILEITETGLMRNQEHAQSILTSLRDYGVQFAIDGFGTGYSSLVYLKYLPVNLLNIDKTFIDNVPYSKKDSAIVSSIIAMAHHLGYKVLAEGVETHKQLAFLQQQGCDEYQGCLYSPAVTAEELVRMLQNNKH